MRPVVVHQLCRPALECAEALTDPRCATRSQKKVSLRTPRSPFRFGRRRRDGGGEAQARCAPSSADTQTPPRPDHNHEMSPTLDPDPEAALLQPPVPPSHRASAHPGADGAWDREGFTTLDRERKDGPDAGDLPRAGAPGEARTRLLLRTTTIAPHPTGTVHVRKAGLPARLRSASRIARTRTASSNASVLRAVRGVLLQGPRCGLGIASPTALTPNLLRLLLLHPCMHPRTLCLVLCSYAACLTNKQGGQLAPRPIVPPCRYCP